MVRRGIALGGGVIVLILLVLGFKSCLGARKDQALKDYLREVNSIAQESNQQSNQLFGLLSNRRRGGDVNVVNKLNEFRAQAATLADRARHVDTPGEMSSAQRYFVQSIELREDGVVGIATQVPNALTQQERRQGTNAVALDMQDFLASDVLYTKRAAPAMQKALEDAGLADETRVPKSQYLPVIDWLQPSFVSQQISGIRTGKSGEPAAPGLHGTGVGTVSVGGQALSDGGSVTVQGASPQFQVQVANQGENDETDVAVKVSVGKGADAVTGTGTVPTIARGENKTVNIKLKGSPPTGQNVPVTVSVEPVPGEKKTDNNKLTGSVIFTR
jgi:CARDB